MVRVLLFDSTKHTFKHTHSTHLLPARHLTTMIARTLKRLDVSTINMETNTENL